jgi:ATP-dependent helicase HepA
MTSSRLRATREEKLDFLTWDHPMVVGILDLILGGTSGSASVALLPGPARGVALEAVFVLEPVTSPGLDASRFLPPTPIRTVVDQGLADVTAALSPATLEGRIHDGRKDLRYRELSFLEKLLPRMLKKARALARKEIAPLLKASLAEARSRLGSEASRLRSLQEVNDHVDRQEALDVARRLRRVTESIASAELRLDSLRVIWQGNPKDRA